jgi:(p)ppGpp synthase/HD superfamily hydrolase
MLTVNRAIEFAAQRHAGKTDQQGVNYIYHVLRVMLAVPERCRAVAVLHDVVEDTSATIDRLEDMGLGFVDAYALDLLSRPPEGLSYKEYINNLVTAEGLAGVIARTIKRADLADNLARIDFLPDEERKRLYSRYIWAVAKLSYSEVTDVDALAQDEAAHSSTSPS